MERIVKKIIEKSTQKWLGRQFLRVTRREFLILKKNGGHMVFNVKEHDHTYHAALALKVENGRTLMFDVVTHDPMH